jgi:hypothetical protein
MTWSASTGIASSRDLEDVGDGQHPGGKVQEHPVGGGIRVGRQRKVAVRDEHPGPVPGPPERLEDRGVE